MLRIQINGGASMIVGAPSAEGGMDWVGTALLMGLAAALSASATLAVVRRREIAARFAGKRAPGVGAAWTPAAAKPRPAVPPAAPAKPRPAAPRRAEDTGFRLPPAPPAAREADLWERRFKLLHSMVPEARRQEIIRHAMAKHGLDRARAIRKIVEDRQGEDSVRN
jgi:hypothetical protein